MLWYAKQISSMTKISVRTLHHYDAIGLLKPTGRASNGYRVYNPDDLMRLQQIIALKHFGFSLTEIKKLLKDSNTSNISQHLKIQEEMLSTRITQLQQTQKTLRNLMTHIKDNKNSLDWKYTQDLIEGYKAMEDFKKAYPDAAITDQQVEQWALMRNNAAKVFTPEVMAKSKDISMQIWKAVQENQNPQTPANRALAQQWKTFQEQINTQVRESFINQISEEEYAQLDKAWEDTAKSIYNNPDIQNAIRQAHNNGLPATPEDQALLKDWIKKALEE